jgi:hypothetical protein
MPPAKLPTPYTNQCTRRCREQRNSCTECKTQNAKRPKSHSATRPHHQAIPLYRDCSTGTAAPLVAQVKTSRSSQIQTRVRPDRTEPLRTRRARNRDVRQFLRSDLLDPKKAHRSSSLEEGACRDFGCGIAGGLTVCWLTNCSATF